MRTYTHKLYDIQGNYLRVLSDNVIFPSFRLDNSINSWVATYSFTIDTKYDEPLASNEYLLIVHEFSEVNKTWWIVFAWTLDNIGGKLLDRENTLTYSFGWLHRLLNQIIYPMTTFTNQKIKDLIQWCVDVFNLKYPLLTSILWWDIIKNGITDETLISQTTANSSFTCLQYITEIMKLSWQRFNIRPDGTIVWWPKPATPTHKFMIHKDILWLEIERIDIQDIVNRVRVHWTWHEDATSVWLYWPREKIESISSTDFATGNLYAEKYLEDNAYGRREIILDIIVDDYSNIYPWQTISIKNTRLTDVNNLEIQKTSYDWYKMTLYLEKYISLPSLIVW